MTPSQSTPLPDEFVERIEQIVPPGWLPQVLESFSLPAATAFRVNTFRGSVDAVLSSLQADGIRPASLSWPPEAFRVAPDERDALLASSAARKRLIYVQNPSSMVPPLILDPQPGEKVLDLTAAPGSKTLQLAAQMQGEGELAAVELSRGRFFKMKALLDAYGASGVRTFLQNGERVWRYRPEHFDRILLDAPCSTEGRFHVADPNTFSYWSRRKIKEMSSKQRRLLFSAIHSLAPGGVLVYSTCTFAPEENEGMIDWALERFGDSLHVDPVDLPLPNAMPGLSEWHGRAFHSGVSGAARILPDGLFEGFFVCRIVKITSTARDK